MFEMGIIYLKIFLLKFEITGFYPFVWKESGFTCRISFPSLLPRVVGDMPCHNWPGGRHLYSRETEWFRFFLREQPMHLAGTVLIVSNLLSTFLVPPLVTLLRKEDSLLGFPTSGSSKTALWPFRLAVYHVNFCPSPTRGDQL